MKKLISVFAALALVGSLAAQKKKPAAKPAPAAPAAPTVAAPAAPVVAAPAMPAAAGSSAGMGLMVFGNGSYTLANGSSSAHANGDSIASAAAATAVEYKTSGSAAFGGGVGVGYNIANNLAALVTFDYRAFKTREYKSLGTNDALVAGASNTTGNPQVSTANNANATWSKSWNNMVIGVGLRPQVDALGGTVYAGGGLAIVLPYSDTVTSTYTDNTGAFTAAKRELVKEWNMGFGMYGEVGYNYNISSNLFVGIGFKAIVVTVDNNGKTGKATTTTTAGVTSTTTTTYTNSLSNTDATNVVNGTETTNKRGFETNGITDLAVTLNVGYRL